MQGPDDPAATQPSRMRGPVGFIAVLLFWPSLLVTLLPAALFGVSLVLELAGASPRVVNDWALGAGYALVLTMVSAPATLVFGIIALATAPPRGR